MHEREPEIDAHFSYHKGGLPELAVWFRADFCLNSIYDAMGATREVSRGEQPIPPPGDPILQVFASHWQ